MTKETALRVWISGVGLLGPGLPGWSESLNILKGEQVYVSSATELPNSALLPPAERRRIGATTRLALAISQEAIETSQLMADQLASVFCTSSGDSHNCHAICEALASSDCRISPIRFHNSVNNAAAGYWSIANHAMRASTMLCAYDASFGAGFLEAATQTIADGNDVLLASYDTEYPEPLKAQRPLQATVGIALVLSPCARVNSLASATLQFTDETPTSSADAALENLRRQTSSARGLTLLEALASGKSNRIVLDYLDPLRLRIDIQPC
jgi:hypothetical protein